METTPMQRGWSGPHRVNQSCLVNRRNDWTEVATGCPGGAATSDQQRRSQRGGNDPTTVGESASSSGCGGSSWRTASVKTENYMRQRWRKTVTATNDAAIWPTEERSWDSELVSWWQGWWVLIEGGATAKLLNDERAEASAAERRWFPWWPPRWRRADCDCSVMKADRAAAVTGGAISGDVESALRRSDCWEREEESKRERWKSLHTVEREREMFLFGEEEHLFLRRDQNLLTKIEG